METQLNNPLISVVIPAFNREKTIDYCLRSVLAQTYSPFEILVVDDGSSDNTTHIVLSLDNPRIRLICHESTKGAQAARNTGIDKAKGDWIAFLDSDDEWYPEKLSKQVAVLESRNWDERVVVHGDMDRYYPDTQLKTHWKLPIITGKDCYATLLRSPGPLFPALLISKTALLEIGLLDENVPSYQEWDTSIRLAKICEFIHLRESLAVYWLHGGETISKDRRRDVTGYQFVIEKHRNEIEKTLGIDGWYQAKAGLAYRCISLGFFDEANGLLNQLPFGNYWRLKGYVKLYMKRWLNWKRGQLC
jgi:glycosyltransferase involved in cell wall biosynthesis